MNARLVIGRGVWILTLALAVIYVAASVPFIFGAGEFDSDAVRLAYGFGGVASGAAMLTGLAVSGRLPNLGASLVIGGAIGMAIIWFWFFYALVPLTLLMAGFAIHRARRGTRQRAITAIA